MNLFSSSLGTRPRLACEIRPEGVVAARCEDGAVGVMVAASRAPLPENALRPAPRAGNLLDRPAIVAAFRQALDKVADRSRDVTLIVPDATVRVLLLEFDTLPTKPAEALPIVRFRLKKLLPFDADDAAITYQLMSSSRSLLRVLAVAMPREVLAEYESALRDAGFEPGAILPSTLAVLAGLEESEAPALLINASPEAVTAAIVRSGILLLHRSVDMRADLHVEAQPEALPAPIPTIPAIPTELLANPADALTLPLVDIYSSAEEWAMQQPLPEHPDVPSNPQAEEAPLPPLPPAEIVQAVSVAAAYFEDTLNHPPPNLLTAGVTSASQLASLLSLTPLGDLPVREMVDPAMLPSGNGPSTSPITIPQGWLAGVRGALRS